MGTVITHEEARAARQSLDAIKADVLDKTTRCKDKRGEILIELWREYFPELGPMSKWLEDRLKEAKPHKAIMDAYVEQTLGPEWTEP